MGVTALTASEAVGSRAALASGGQFYRAWVSPTRRAIARCIAEIAATDIPVLMVGERGTGKGVVAAELHDASPRREQDFRKLPAALALPEQLTLEGLQRDGGTLYLDEVGDLSAAAQAQLLRTLARAEDSAAGQRPRLLCSSSGNLEELMRSGRFQEALFFWLNGVCLRLPPLRQCRLDIRGLSEFFLGKFAAMFGRPRPALSQLELRALAEHPWPGNIRQLETAMKEAVVLGGEIAGMIEDGGLPAASIRSGLSLKEVARAASRQAEREMILRALARTRWNRKRAARELRISYKALLYKLKQIEPGEAAGF